MYGNLKKIPSYQICRKFRFESVIRPNAYIFQSLGTEIHEIVRTCFPNMPEPRLLSENEVILRSNLKG